MRVNLTRIFYFNFIHCDQLPLLLISFPTSGNALCELQQHVFQAQAVAKIVLERSRRQVWAINPESGREVEAAVPARVLAMLSKQRTNDSFVWFQMELDKRGNRRWHVEEIEARPSLFLMIKLQFSLFNSAALLPTLLVAYEDGKKSNAKIGFALAADTAQTLTTLAKTDTTEDHCKALLSAGVTYLKSGVPLVQPTGKTFKRIWVTVAPAWRKLVEAFDLAMDFLRSQNKQPVWLDKRDYPKRVQEYAKMRGCAHLASCLDGLATARDEEWDDMQYDRVLLLKQMAPDVLPSIRSLVSEIRKLPQPELRVYVLERLGVIGKHFWPFYTDQMSREISGYLSPLVPRIPELDDPTLLSIILCRSFCLQLGWWDCDFLLVCIRAQNATTAQHHKPVKKRRVR